MSIKFERTILKFDIYGEIFEIKKPTYGEIEQFEIEFSSGDVQKRLEAVKNFLNTKGFTQEVLAKLEIDHIQEIFQYLSGKKKVEK